MEMVTSLLEEST